MLTRQAEACADSERCYEVHGRAFYVYSIRWFNRGMPLPETWVHASGFSVDTHPMDPMDDLAVLHLEHMYIGHDESGVISIKTDCVNVQPKPHIEQRIEALVARRLNNYHVFIEHLIRIMIETNDDDFEVREPDKDDPNWLRKMNNEKATTGIA